MADPRSEGGLVFRALGRPMTLTFSAEELSAESGVSVERIRWLVDIGIIQRHHPEGFVAGDGFRAKMIDALLEAGISPEQIEMAVRSRNLGLSHVDRYILIEPGPRSERNGIAGARDDLANAPSVDIANGAPTGADATDQIVLTWVDGKFGLNNEPVLLSTSTDGGSTWTTPRKIDGTGRPSDRGYYSAP